MKTALYPARMPSEVELEIVLDRGGSFDLCRFELAVSLVDKQAQSCEGLSIRPEQHLQHIANAATGHV